MRTPNTTEWIRNAASRRFLWIVGCVVVLMASFSVYALAGTDDTVRDVPELREKARLGDAEAHYVLAARHRDGDGVPRDYGEALRLFRLAANQDGTAPGSARSVALARLSIGNMYWSGQGVPIDFAETAKSFQRAMSVGVEEADDVVMVASLNLRQATRSFASQGDLEAQALLGTWYANGNGVPQDYATALKWLEPAAKRGNPLAQAELGRLYLFGMGVESDLGKALLLLLLSAERGNVASYYNLGVVFEHMLKDDVLAHALYNVAGARGYAMGDADARPSHEDIERQLSSEQIAEAQALAGEIHRSPAIRDAVRNRLSPALQRALVRTEGDFARIAEP